MDKKIIDNDWVVYVNASKEERMAISNTLKRLPFKFTEGDCLSMPCRKYLFNNTDPLIVFVGGSVLTGLTDFLSDYDITAITKENVRLVDPNYSIFRGRHIHSYLHTMDSVIDVIDGDAIHAVGLIKFAYLTRDKIIYSTLSEDLLEDFLNHKKDLLQAGIIKFDEFTRNYIDEVISTGQVSFKGPIKLLATALEIQHLLKNEPLEKDKEYILKVKRIKKLGFRDLDISRLIKDLKEYKQLVEEYKKTHNFEEAVNSWKSSFAYQEIKKLSGNP